MILKAYKYRIYPTKEQETLIGKHIGACRFVYNLALETKQTAYAGYQVNLTCFDLTKQLTDLKKECVWLKEIGIHSLQQSIIDLDVAYTRFFKGICNFPKYKSKHNNKQSFTAFQSLKIENTKLYLAKFTEGIEIILHRGFFGKIKRATISKTPTNKYFASILVEELEDITPKKKITESNTIGIDLGIKDFLTTSKGDKVANPRYFKKSLSKLKFLQRKYSKYKGKRTKHKLTIQHEKVANKRKDFLHKVSKKLIDENQTIALETLQIKNMVQNHNLAQSINDVGWGMFVDMLEYKAEWYGANIIKIGTFEPSSKTCSCCGIINKKLTLSDRFWTCEKCSTSHDRDINAAVNIKNFALRNHLSKSIRLKNQKELPTLVGAMTSELTL